MSKVEYIEKLLSDTKKAMRELQEYREAGRIDETFYTKEMDRLEIVEKNLKKDRTKAKQADVGRNK